jgi:hypothetical protein
MAAQIWITNLCQEQISNLSNAIVTGDCELIKSKYKILKDNNIWSSSLECFTYFPGILHSLIERGSLYVLGDEIIQDFGSGGLWTSKDFVSGSNASKLLQTLESRNSLGQTFFHSFASNCCIYDEPYKSLFKRFLGILEGSKEQSSQEGFELQRVLDSQDIFGYTIAHYVLEQNNSSPCESKCDCILKILKDLGASFDIPNLLCVTVNQMLEG